MSVWLTIKILVITIVATMSMVHREEILCNDLLRTTLDGKTLECGLPLSPQDIEKE